MKASELRNAILSRAKPRVRRAGHVPGLGDIFVKSATLAEQKELLRLGGAKPHPTLSGEMVVEDPIRLSVLAVVKLAVDESGERIFSDADVGAVEAFPVEDAYWRAITQAALEALNPASESVARSREDFAAEEVAASSSR